MGFESLVERVKSIPPLPESVKKIEALYLRGNPSLTSIVKIIEEDPVLTANILAAVNSPLYFLRSNISSVHQCVMLFGLQTVRGFVLSAATKSTFSLDMSPYGISNEEFQTISLMQSTLMFRWYMGVNIEDANLLVPIAFLMDIGQVIIAKEVAESDYHAEFTKMLKEGIPITEVEKIFTGMSSSEVTALLFEHWNFSELFVDVLRGSDEPSLADREYKSFCEAIDVVKTCINVQNPLTQESFKASKEKVMQYGFNLAKYIKTVEHIEEKKR